MSSTVPDVHGGGPRRAWEVRLGLARLAAQLRADVDPATRADLLAVVNDLLHLAVERDALGWRRSWRGGVARRRTLLDERAEQLVDALCELCAGPGRPGSGHAPRGGRASPSR